MSSAKSEMARPVVRDISPSGTGSIEIDACASPLVVSGLDARLRVDIAELDIIGSFLSAQEIS
jgi:hypothetical protein